MTQPNLKEILEWWEKEHPSNVRMGGYGMVMVNDAMMALKEAIEVINNISQGGNPECCCAFDADAWLEKWGMK